MNAFAGLGGVIVAMFAVGFVLVGLSMRPRKAVVTATVVPAVAAAPQIAWPALIDPEIGALDEAARIDVVARLGVLPGPWSVDVLAAAYREERAPAVRDTIVLALARGGDTQSAATLRAAATATRVSERSLAVAGLASLGELDALEALLGDEALSVALAALRALEAAGERARVERFIAGAAPVTAAALRLAREDERPAALLAID